MQVVLAVLFAALFIVWLFRPDWDYLKILSLIGNALGFFGMISSYRAEEKNKKSNNQ